MIDISRPTENSAEFFTACKNVVLQEACDNKEYVDKSEFDFLKGLSDEDLDDLLESATDDLMSAIDENQYDTEAASIIDAVMDEFERRKSDDSDMTDNEIQQSLDRFYERARAEGMITNNKVGYSAKRKRNFSAVIAASILIVILSAVGLSISADADQYSIWDKFISWSKETFNWWSAEPAVSLKNEEENNISNSNPMIAELNNVLIQNGLLVELPAWVPGGYAMGETEIDVSGNTKVIIAWFERGGEFFSLTVSELPDRNPIDVQSSAEENAEGGEIYKTGNIDHYITINESRCSAIWRQGNIWIKLQGNLSFEEMKRMINSIYER